MLLDNLAKRIRKRREERGLRQADIANALQVSSQAVSKWERAENAPDITLIAGLSKLLGVSVDWLLGINEEGKDVFEATVFVSGVKGYARKAQSLEPGDLAAWLNGFLCHLTEVMLKHDGVPIKQTGDGLLCIFSGAGHNARAVDASLNAARTVNENLTVALAAGKIYLGSIGHPDYNAPDIIGEAVNIAFRTLELSKADERSEIFATAAVVDDMKERLELDGPYVKDLGFIPDPVEMYEIKI